MQRLAVHLLLPSCSKVASTSLSTNLAACGNLKSTLRFDHAKTYCSGSYVQGQTPKEGLREYFYYIDHQGQLFLDDAKFKNFTSCFKEKDFLVFFFTRLRPNGSGRYEESFPWLSLCGRERNLIRCDDVPIVFTHLLPTKEDADTLLFSYCNGGERLSVPFEPHRLCMLPETGRVYYPAPIPKRHGVSALVKSTLALEFAPLFVFDDGHENPPTAIRWHGDTIPLSNELTTLIRQ